VLRIAAVGYTALTTERSHARTGLNATGLGPNNPAVGPRLLSGSTDSKQRYSIHHFICKVGATPSAKPTLNTQNRMIAIKLSGDCVSIALRVNLFCVPATLPEIKTAISLSPFRAAADRPSRLRARNFKPFAKEYEDGQHRLLPLRFPALSLLPARLLGGIDVLDALFSNRDSGPLRAAHLKTCPIATGRKVNGEVDLRICRVQPR